MMIIDFSKQYLRLKAIADERHQQKKQFKSCKQLSPNYEVVGVIGEYITGQYLNEEPNFELLIDGDSGIDFSNEVNVKASEHFKAKHLIEDIDKKVYPENYLFVIVNLINKTGYLAGWISAKEFFEKSEIINFGYGDRYAILLTELHPIDTYPPYIHQKKQVRKLFKNSNEITNKMCQFDAEMRANKIAYLEQTINELKKYNYEPTINH